MGLGFVLVPVPSFVLNLDQTFFRGRAGGRAGGIDLNCCVMVPHPPPLWKRRLSESTLNTVLEFHRSMGPCKQCRDCCVCTFSLDQFKRIADANLWGLIDVSKTFLPLLKKSKGRVVNIVSILGTVCIQLCLILRKYSQVNRPYAKRRVLIFIIHKHE